MEKLDEISFIGVLEHIGMDGDTVVIRMQCEDRVLIYRDEKNKEFELKQSGGYNQKICAFIQRKSLKTTDPLACFAKGDRIELTRDEEIRFVYGEKKRSYALKNLTLISKEWVKLNSEE